MIFSTCVVSYREMVNNRERILLLEEILCTLSNNVDIITLPAGYLFCRNKKEVSEYSEIIKRLSDQYETHITLGIDCEKIEEFGSISKYSLPYLALLATPNKPPRLWKQHSYKTSDTGEIQLSKIVESRSIIINNNHIEILACGDLFNPAVLENIIARDVDLVIALIHSGSGPRTQRAMEYLAKNGVHSFCSHHAKVKNAFKYGYTPINDGRFNNISTRDNDYLLKKFNQQIEIKIWKI